MQRGRFSTANAAALAPLPPLLSPMREMDLSTDLALVTEAATDVAVAAAAAAADDDDVIGDMHIK